MSRRQLCAGLLALGTKSMLGSVAQAVEGIMAIDTHAHVFKLDLALAVTAATRRPTTRPSRTISPCCDRNGMSHGVLIQPSFLGTDNSYLVEALRTAPDRLRGIVVVAPEIGRTRVARILLPGGMRRRPPQSASANRTQRSKPRSGKRHLAVWRRLGWQVEVQAEARRLPACCRRCCAGGAPCGRGSTSAVRVPALGIDDPGFRYCWATGASGRDLGQIVGRVSDRRQGIR